MRIVIGIIVSVVFGLGFARLSYDSPPLTPIPLDGSTKLAECLKPQGEIQIGTPITLPTTITVWGFIYVYIVSGSLLTMTTEMMELLGIAGLGTVAARWLGARETAATPQGTPSQASANASTDMVFWRILSTNGNFDLLKLQLFLFTVTIAAYVVYRILDSAAFPALDANTLLLLGVSQGVYIGGKVAGTTALANAQTLKIELDVKNDVLKKLSAEQTALESDKARLDKAKETGQLMDKVDIERLNALPGLIQVKKKEVDEAKSKLDKTKADYDKAVKELFPTPA